LNLRSSHIIKYKVGVFPARSEKQGKRNRIAFCRRVFNACCGITNYDQ